jgi:DNA repair exonuclease SbcCD ATPase subunit
MRIHGLEVDGFRGLAGSHSFDLSGDVVIIVGANGSGKTSVLDSILWALSGDLPRITEGGGGVVSGYSSNGETRVRLQLREPYGDVLDLVRTQVGDRDPRLVLNVNGHSWRGLEADVELLRRVWPPALDATEPTQAFCGALARSVYLQQDLVREFIEADTEQQRFDVLTELVGAGRIRELQAQLEQAKRAWTTATNSLRKELGPRIAQLSDRRSWLTRLSEGVDGEPSLFDRSRPWRERLAKLDTPLGGEIAKFLDRRTLDLALGELAAHRRRLQRALADVEELLAIPSVDAPSDTELAAARQAKQEAGAALEQTERALADATQTLATERQAVLERRERDRDLALLAELALRHLDAECPVCTQPYDRAHTIAHLNGLLAVDKEPDNEPASSADTLTELAGVVQEAQTALAEATLELQRLEGRRATAAAAARQQQEMLAALPVQPREAASPRAALSMARDAIVAELNEIASLTQEGEELALVAARQTEGERRAEVEEEVGQLAKNVRREETILAERDATGELAQELIVGIRERSSDVIDDQLSELQPLLSRIYGRIDPHPALRDVSLRAWVERGRGRIEPVLADEVFGFRTTRPAAVLSSSQLNSLALATFLTLNLGVGHVPLETAILDDPLQSLDDVNLLGVIDLLRRVRTQRQLFVSTHDERFGTLLERKLRGIAQHRTVRIDLHAWSRTGPQVTQREIEPDPKPLRLVAA